jgi:PAS domain S-box-containing protein
MDGTTDPENTGPPEMTPNHRQDRSSLEHAQALAHLGSWDLEIAPRDSAKRGGTWSAELFRLLYRDPALGVPSFAGLLELIHPDDRKEVDSAMARAHEITEPHPLMYRTNPANGPVRYISAIVHVLRDANGVPVKTTGTALDVTQRVHADIASRRLAAIIEGSDDAIIGVTLEGIVTDWNSGAENIFGYRAEEMIGGSVLRLVPGDRQEETLEILRRVRKGEKTRHFETVRVARDGRLLNVAITASPIRDANGEIVGASKIARDVTVQKEHEQEIARLSRLYAALSHVNQSIVWAPTEADLFERVCSVLVGEGGFLMAWIGLTDPATDRLRPVAHAGDDDGYLQSIDIHTAGDRPEARGPAATALREKRPYISNDLLNDPAAIPWKAKAEQRGMRAGAVFPIYRDGEVCGALTVYAAESYFFRDREVALLGEAANDISFALENLDREAARRQAEATLRHERDFSAAVLNSLPGILYLHDESGKFLRWNENFERVTGYSAAQIATMSPLDFVRGYEKELTAERIREVFEKGESDIEAGLVSKDGRVTPYYFTGMAAILDGQRCLVGVGIDIAARKRAEAALRQSEARYRTLFEWAPDGILVGDPSGTYVDANASVCKMLGYRREELIGLTGADIVVADEVPHLASALEVIKSRALYHGEWLFRRKDATVFPVEVMGTTMPDGNILAMVRDVTERREAEDELQRLHAELERRVIERTAQLQAANKELEAFSYSVSHDLRAPLRAVNGFAGMVLDEYGGQVPDDARRYLERIRDRARGMGELIDDLLAFSRLSRQPLKKLRVNTEKLVRNILDDVAPQYEGRHVEVRVGPLPGCWADLSLLRQVWTNLLSNAIKYTRPREHAEIEIGCTSDESGDVFYVRDNGTGFDMKYVHKLFGVFQRLHRAEDFEGTGVGLAIVQRIVHRHGGRVWAEAEIGHGAAFYFTLGSETGS